MSGTCKGRIPNTPLCIDDFHPSHVQAFLDTPLASSCQLLFFLSHLHADHTRGLSPSWQHGHIYTTHTNRHLLLHRYSLPPQCITALHYNTPTALPLSPHYPHPTFTLNLLPVHHCPGACMLVLDGYWGRIVYTGDMRWLQGAGLGGEGGVLLSRPIDVLYLDNTYGNERYQRFMSREAVVAAIVDVIAAHGGGEVCDVLINSDMLGKEDVLVMVARRCRCLIAVDEDKYAMLKALHSSQYDLNDSYSVSNADEGEWMEGEQKEERKEVANVGEEERLDAEALSYPSWLYRFTTNRADTFLHVAPKRQLNRRHVDDLNEARSRDGRRPLIAIYMTGWAVDAEHHKQHHTATPVEIETAHSHLTSVAVVSEPTPASAAGSKRHPLSPHSPTHFCSGDATHPCGIHLLPFSSHSSYSELRAFLSHIRPRSIMPISSPLTPTPLYSAYLDPTPPTAITLPAELLRATLKDAEWMRRRAIAAGHLQLVRRRRSESWLGSKRRRTFALTGDEEQLNEPLTATQREYKDDVTPEEVREIESVLDLTSNVQPLSPSHRTEIVISSLSSDDVLVLSPPAASSCHSLDDPVRHFSLRINPARRHLLSRLSLTDFHTFDVPATSPDTLSSPCRSGSTPSPVTTLAAHTASLPIRRLPAFLLNTSTRRDTQSCSIRPPPSVVASVPPPILHPTQLLHPWSAVSSYRSTAAPSSSRHTLPLCAAPPAVIEPEWAALRNVTSAVNNMDYHGEGNSQSAHDVNGVTCSGSFMEVLEMPPLEPA